MMPKSSKKSLPSRSQASKAVPRASPADGNRRWAWTSAGIVIVAVLVVYGRSIDAPFIFDDINSVQRNDSIKKLWPLVGDAENPGPLYGPKFAPTSARPVVNLSLALNYQLGGLEPRGYRLVNIGLHVCSALLLGAIVRRTLSLPYFASRYDAAAGWLALAASLVWALHPLQTEAVVYVTQRTELMVGFFYLATLYCSLRYWTTSPIPLGKDARDGSCLGERIVSTINTDRTGWLVLASLACAAGMGSKQIMVSAPLIALLYERAFIAGSIRKALRDSWPLYIGLSLGWLLLLWLNYGNPHSDSTGFQHGVPGYVWWFTQAKVLLMYLKLVVWPWPLVIHYEMPYLQSLGQAWMYLVPVALLGIGILVWLWRNYPIGFLGTCVFAILMPTLVIPIVSEVAAERRMYLPLAAISVLVVVGGYEFARWIVARRKSGSSSTAHSSAPLVAVIAPALVLATALAAVSHKRLASYDVEMTLWQEVLRLQPDNHVAHSNVGLAHYDAGNLAVAAEHFREAIRLKPDSSLAHYNLALVLGKIGNIDEAIEHFRLAVKYRPGSPELLNNLGVSLYVAGRYDEAIRVLREAIELKPGMWRAHDNLGSALSRAGRWSEAIEKFQHALKLNPQALDVYGHLADAQAKAGQSAEAVATAERALRLAQASGADATAAKIETQLTAFRNGLTNADERVQVAPDFGSALPTD
jgi:Tfp pilus assembly protein PilF